MFFCLDFNSISQFHLIYPRNDIDQCCTPDISQYFSGIIQNQLFKIGDYGGNVLSFVTMQIGNELDDVVLNAIATYLIENSKIRRVKLIDCLFMESPAGFEKRILADVEDIEVWKFYIMLNPGTTVEFEAHLSINIFEFKDIISIHRKKSLDAS